LGLAIGPRNSFKRPAQPSARRSIHL